MLTVVFFAADQEGILGNSVFAGCVLKRERIKVNFRVLLKPAGNNK